MSRNRLQLSKTVVCYYGSDHAIGQFIDFTDSRFAKSGKDEQGEGFVMEWCAMFGFTYNPIKAKEDDLQGCFDNPSKVLKLIDDYISKL